MVAPALLAPPPWRAPAVAGALVFGAAASVLRMAFGGHFLSDVLLGGLISLLVDPRRAPPAVAARRTLEGLRAAASVYKGRGRERGAFPGPACAVMAAACPRP